MDTGLPVGLDLADGWTVRFTALTASTGAVDTSVIVSGASLLVDNLGGGDLTSGFADVEPLFTPLPANLFAPETP